MLVLNGKQEGAVPRSAYNKGAKKAQAAFKKRYGASWQKYYYGKANKYGKGKSRAAKANSVYGKGAHRVGRKRVLK